MPRSQSGPTARSGRREHQHYRDRQRHRQLARARRRRIAAGLAVLLVIGAAAGAITAFRHRAEDRRAHDPSLAATRDRPRAPIVSRATTPLAAEPAPRSYHVVYEVHDAPTGKDVVTTEEDWVRRPFDGRQELRTGPPPGKRLTATSISAFARFEQRNGGASTAQVLEVPPNAPSNDLRPDAVRDQAVAAKRFTPREHRRVAGRECQVVRTRRATASGSLAPSANDAGALTDLCFDAHGLLLEEVTFRDARIVHRRVATTVDVDPALEDSRFAVSDTAPVPVGQGGGSVRQLVATSRPPGGQFYELAGDPPPGFTLQGRYTVVPPQPEAFTDPTKRNNQIAGVADVYTRGPDFLIIDRGSTLGGGPAFTALPTSTAVDLGANGRGELILGMTGSQVRVILPDSHYLRVVGTLPGDELADLARRMQPQPPGELEFIDGA